MRLCIFAHACTLYNTLWDKSSIDHIYGTIEFIYRKPEKDNLVNVLTKKNHATLCMVRDCMCVNIGFIVKDC